MDAILKKSEISDLLSAIREGKVSLDLDENEQNAFLACSPVNLFQLARPDREQFRIPNFDIILDSFCRLYCHIFDQPAATNHFDHQNGP